ncbi:MAG: CsbD family protein [Pseudonocardiaceae bacterium]
MSFADKFRDKIQVLRGRMKRNTGEVTGSRRLQAEGRADEVMGNLKQAGEKVKDAFRGRGTRPRRRRRQY